MQRQLTGIMLMIVALMTVSLLAPAANAQSTGWASWLIDVDFAGNKTNAYLTVVIEFADPDKDVIKETVLLECADFGVQIVNEQAQFSGTDYILCHMPDLVDFVYQLSQGELLISPVCSCAKDPWVEADLAIDATPSQNEPIYPVFYRPDLQFATPLVDRQKAMMHFSVDHHLAWSGSFTFNDNQFQRVHAEFRNTAPQLYEPYFIADRQPLPAMPPAFQTSLGLSNYATLIYIGYSPQSDTYFEGTIRRLRVDPACRGFG